MISKTYGGLGANVSTQDGMLQSLRMAAGVASITMGSNKVTTYNLTFPTGRFTTAPSVTVTPNWAATYSASVVVIITTYNVTTTGCEIRVMRVGSERAITLHWHAIQYT